MWFKQKRKTKSNIRFHDPRFKRQLRMARQYRRVTHMGRRGDIKKIFSALPKGWTLLFVLVGLLAVYVLFIPNIFFVRSVEILEANSEVAVRLQAQVKDYISHNRFFLLPQNNLLLLRKDLLIKFLIDTNSEVSEVKSVKKKLWNNLQITIIPRQPGFVLQLPMGGFVVSGDGVVMSSATSPLTPGSLVLVKDNREGKPELGQRYFTPLLLSAINASITTLPQVTGLVVQSIELIPVYSTPKGTKEGEQAEKAVLLPTQDIIIYTGKDAKKSAPSFRILFNIHSNLVDSINRTALLLSQQSPERLKNLSYVDMRFKDKAFVCLVTSPCSKDSLAELVSKAMLSPTPPIPTPTPTPSISAEQAKKLN